MHRSAAAGLVFMLLHGGSATAAPPARQDCGRPAVVLWGDGRHDDTAALNAWLRGDNAIWGASGAPVGPVIAARDFRLSGAIYVSAGTGRTIENFRLLWPERGERVVGAAIVAGTDPDKAPLASGVHITGGDPGEGKPFESPDTARPRRDALANCGIS